MPDLCFEWSGVPLPGPARSAVRECRNLSQTQQPLVRRHQSQPQNFRRSRQEAIRGILLSHFEFLCRNHNLVRQRSFAHGVHTLITAMHTITMISRLLE